MESPQTEILALSGEVFVVVGIPQEFVSPFFLHVVDFGLEAFNFFRGVLMAAAYGFVVEEFGVGGPQVSVAGLAHLEAEVHIVEGDGEVFLIQAAHFLEDAFAQDKAGGGDGREVLDE